MKWRVLPHTMTVDREASPRTMVVYLVGAWSMGNEWLSWKAVWHPRNGWVTHPSGVPIEPTHFCKIPKPPKRS